MNNLDTVVGISSVMICPFNIDIFSIKCLVFFLFWSIVYCDDVHVVHPKCFVCGIGQHEQLEDLKIGREIPI
jgi:hypothetical protein